MMSMMMMMGNEDMMESGSPGGSFGSGSELQAAEDPRSSNELDVVGVINDLQDDQLQQHQPPPKKKRYHRHTSRQIHEMEALFNENPHPDDKQRMRLSQELGLNPSQVKFWFQNRRTQMKAQQDRAENVMLIAENENLKAENCHLMEELRCLSCTSCGGPTVLGDIPFNELHIENTRLREEITTLTGLHRW